MIEWLSAPTSGYFYREKSKVPASAIENLFRDIRAKHSNVSQNIFKHVRDTKNGARWSAISFYYEREPSFLDIPAGKDKERVAGFLFIVESKGYVAVFKAGLDLSTEFKKTYLRSVGADRVEAAIARVGATFEQIRLRNMDSSRYALRSKTLEARDLQTVASSAGSSRYVPRGYRVQRNDGNFATTPNTGRISMRSDRVDHIGLILWATKIIEQLTAKRGETAQFITTFARPIDLSSLPDDVSPTSIAIDVPRLVDELLDEHKTKRLIRTQGDAERVLTKEEVEVVLASLDRQFEVKQNKSGDIYIVDPGDGKDVGEISMSLSRIALKKLNLPEILNLSVKDIDNLAEDPIALRRYLDRENFLNVFFSDVSIVYIDGELFRDQTILSGGETFMARIKALPALKDAIEEKGLFKPKQVAFDADSVFGLIEADIASKEEFLVCDDLGDEWADYIGITCHTEPKTISFYHAKHGPVSNGASHLHVAVSQAMKNLGNMRMATQSMGQKLSKWGQSYKGENVETNITRLRRGDAKLLEEKIREAAIWPDTIRRVYIVTSSLSKGELEKEFDKIKKGKKPAAHFVQLYWLLMSYFSACAEANTLAYVFCRE